MREVEELQLEVGELNESIATFQQERDEARDLARALWSALREVADDLGHIADVDPDLTDSDEETAEQPEGRPHPGDLVRVKEGIFLEWGPFAHSVLLLQDVRGGSGMIRIFQSRDLEWLDGDTTEPSQWAIWSYVHGGWRAGDGHVIDPEHADRFTAREARALIDDEARDGLADGKPRSLMMLGPEVRTADTDVTVMNARLKWAFGNEMRKYGTDGHRTDLTTKETD